MMKIIALFLLLACVVATNNNNRRRRRVFFNEEYVPTPQGYVLKHCHHTVPNGSILNELTSGELEVMVDNKVIKIIPLCKSDAPTFVSKTGVPLYTRRRRDRHHRHTMDYDGWLEYTQYYSNSSFDSYLGTFSVPDRPNQFPEILYLFTGLQSDDWVPVVDPTPDPISSFDIIQPVLQYPADESAGWSVKSWYVTLDVGTVASDEILTSPGDAIFGNMTRVGAQSWFIGSTVISSNRTTSVTVNHQRLANQPYAFNTLECYGCNGCDTYPNNSPCKFTNLKLYHQKSVITPTWQVNPNPSKNHFCKEKIVVESPSEVTIYFNPQSQQQ